MEIYMVVAKDRHTDDDIQVFTRLITALKYVTEIQAEYKGTYEWTEEEIDGWEYYTSAGDDCPSIRIERKEVH